MAVAGFFTQVVHGIGTAAARFIDHHKLILCEVVFFQRRQHSANEDIVSAARPGVHNDLNGLARLESLRKGWARCAKDG
jgi:molybdopterin/thiamine biosynthesis adenylyltransferase